MNPDPTDGKQTATPQTIPGGSPQVTQGSPPPPPKRRRLWLWILGGLLGVVLALGVVGALMLPRWVLERIKQEARQRGVELSQCTLTLGLDQLLLEGCHVQVSKPVQASGTVDIIAVALVDYKPSHVDVTGAKFEVRGKTELNNLLENRPSSRTELPVYVYNSEVALFTEVGPFGSSEEAALQLTQLDYSSKTDVLTAQLDAAGLLRGPLEVNREGVTLDLTLVPSPDTTLHVKLRHQQAQGLDRAGRQKGLGAQLELSFKNLPVQAFDLPPVLKIPKELSQLVVDANFDIQLPDRARAGQPKGTMDVALRGLVFPVPRAIQGLVYGETAHLTGNFTLNRSYTKAKLENLQLKKAALTLRGSGSVEQEGFGLAIKSEMRGSLSCQAIAQAAATAELSPELAKLAKTIARRALNGSVQIGVKLDTHTSRLDSAQIAKAVGVGCGLQALSFEDALQLGDEVLKDLPELPLPKLPPPAFEPPKFPPPKLKLPFPGKRLVPPGREDPAEGDSPKDHEPEANEPKE